MIRAAHSLHQPHQRLPSQHPGRGSDQGAPPWKRPRSQPDHPGLRAEQSDQADHHDDHAVVPPPQNPNAPRPCRPARPPPSSSPCLRNDHPVDGKTTKKTDLGSRPPGPPRPECRHLPSPYRTQTGTRPRPRLRPCHDRRQHAAGLRLLQGRHRLPHAVLRGYTITYPSAERPGHGNAPALASRSALPTIAVKKSTKVTQADAVDRLSTGQPDPPTQVAQERQQAVLTIKNTPRSTSSDTAACMSVYAPLHLLGMRQPEACAECHHSPLRFPVFVRSGGGRRLHRRAAAGDHPVSPSARGLVRKPHPHHMCMVASATVISSRAPAVSPLPSGMGTPARWRHDVSDRDDEASGVRTAPTTTPAAHGQDAPGAAM